jgi:hypothetical protein
MSQELTKWKRLHISSFVFGFVAYCQLAEPDVTSFPLAPTEFAPHRQEIPAELFFFSAYAQRTCYTMLHYHMAMSRVLTLNPCKTASEWAYAGELLRRFYNV